MLKLLYSGAKTFLGQSSYLTSFGGFPSSTEIVESIDNIFSDLSQFSVQSNKTETKAIVILNSATTPIFNLKVWFEDTSGQNSDELDDSKCTLEIGVQPLTTNSCGEIIFPYSITNANQNPLGVVFQVNIYNSANAIAIGTLSANQMVGLWIRRRLKPEALQPLPDETLCAITDGTLTLPTVESIALQLSYDE